MVAGGNLLLAAAAALAAGAVNALAGGGTLITFPVLLAIGIPPIAANVTNTVALCPGYLGGTLAQKSDLREQKGRLLLLVPTGLLGGIAGGALLLQTGERMFRTMVPFLILFATLLLGIQGPVRGWLQRRAGNRTAWAAVGPAQAEPSVQVSREISGTPAGPGRGRASLAKCFLPIVLASVYGGYFGAGLSVILLAALALLLVDSLTRLNALKQAVAFAANAGAAVIFVPSGKVIWPLAALMALAAMLGGLLGGRLAGRVRAATLRWIVVGLGILVAAAYLVR